MTELIDKTSNSSTIIKQDNSPDINRKHFLMNGKISREVISGLAVRLSEYENNVKIYDEHTSAPIAVSEDRIFPLKLNKFKPVYDKPIYPDPRKYGFSSMQKWEGTVVEVSEDSFLARLVDITNSTNNDGSEEIVEIPNEDVSSKDDLELIVPGAIFYWNIGYQTVNSQAIKASIIRFRRLPKWSAKKKESIRQKGKAFMDGLVWE